MLVLNEGRRNELSLRLVLESNVYGREYFDHCDDIKELLEAVQGLVKSASEASADDRVERAVMIAIVPKCNYGDECGYGFGL